MPGLTSTIARGLTFWRRSIQARVVVSTVLLSALVASGVGWFLLQQTRDGLVEHRLAAVLAEAGTETADARARLDRAPGTDIDAAGQRAELVEQIIARGEVRDFGVVMAGPVTGLGQPLGSGGASFTPGLDIGSVPDRLQRHFAGPAAAPAWTYTTIVQTRNGHTRSVPGIVVGAQVQLPADDSTYTLYYLFPLDGEEETLGLVTRSLLTAGALLLVLVAALTWLVTRQVVTPVRLARRTAERLAAGQLQERVQVRGEDDLARLGMSFNQMAASLQQQIRRLEDLSRVQRRFVSDVSHELRTPLTTVRMASDVLHDARGQFDPATGRAAELLQTELDRFEVLLADLLEISRFDAGAAVLEVERLDLVEVCRQSVDMVAALASRRSTRLIVRDPGYPCTAAADPRRVGRIVRNLLTNAIDHAESGDVLIEVAADDQAAAITVRDFGVGLAPGEAAMVFNRFWRADPARARTSGGTGLGLAIALEDAHLHGGWLQAWGMTGHGAQFRLTLPREAGGALLTSPLPLVPIDVPGLVS